MRYLIGLALLFTSCLPRHDLYLKNGGKRERFHESACFIILAIDARHLDYTHASLFLKSVAKHPSDGSKNSDFGHAWIYLKKGDEVFEGGHSAERGFLQPRYIEGVCLLAEKGDPNPGRYLWAEQQDGYCELGSGGHRPTFAAKIDLSEEQYEQVVAFIAQYPFNHYAISGHNCASFVADIAALIGLPLDYQETLMLPPIVMGMPLWRDPCYACITIASPDRLEKSLIDLVRTGQAEPARQWLIRHNNEPFLPRCKRTLDDLRLLPRRTWRVLQCYST